MISEHFQTSILWNVHVHSHVTYTLHYTLQRVWQNPFHILYYNAIYVQMSCTYNCHVCTEHPSFPSMQHCTLLHCIVLQYLCSLLTQIFVTIQIIMPRAHKNYCNSSYALLSWSCTIWVNELQTHATLPILYAYCRSGYFSLWNISLVNFSQSKFRCQTSATKIGIGWHTLHKIFRI